MRVKVGNNWYSAQPGVPITVELTDHDKNNISNMHPDCTKYVVFAVAGSTTAEEKLQ